MSKRPKNKNKRNRINQVDLTDELLRNVLRDNIQTDYAIRNELKHNLLNYIPKGNDITDYITEGGNASKTFFSNIQDYAVDAPEHIVSKPDRTKVNLENLVLSNPKTNYNDWQKQLPNILKQTNENYFDDNGLEYAPNGWKPKISGAGGSDYWGYIDDRRGSEYYRYVTDHILNNPTYQKMLMDEFELTNPSQVKEYLTDKKGGPFHDRAFQIVYNNISGPQTENIKSYPERTRINPENIPFDINQWSKQLPKILQQTDDDEEKKDKTPHIPSNWMRMAPIFDNLRSVLEQNKPDYTLPRQIASLYNPIDYRPIGKHMSYTPIDQYNLMNRANQANNTLLGVFANNASTPAARNFYALNANQNYQQGLANNYIQGMQYNDAKHEHALAFNNNLDMANEQNRLNIEGGNRQAYTNLMSMAYQLADQERLAVEEARNRNLQHLAENIGEVGKELTSYDLISHMRHLGYGPFASYYKGKEDEEEA